MAFVYLQIIMIHFNFSAFLLYGLAPVLLALTFFIECFVWYIRAMSLEPCRSKTFATSNIIMYCSRVFLVTYQIIINYSIEIGRLMSEIITVIKYSMILAFIMCLVFYSKLLTNLFWSTYLKIVNFVGFCDSKNYRLVSFSTNLNIIHLNRLTVSSLLSTFVLLLVYTAPQLFAINNYQYRLTASSLGQLLSFGGMIITLFVLDPILFSLQDRNKLEDGFSFYIIGRIVAMFVISFVLIFFGD
jgi:hypothetical protein